MDFRPHVGDGAKGDRYLEAESPKNRRPNVFRRMLENPEFSVWMMHDGDELPFGA